jgi:lipopolysaccharide/colanic/teichoic acid biosynthesis glycosyltransferase
MHDNDRLIVTGVYLVYLTFKRILDFAFAAILLLLFSPFFIIVPVLIKLNSKGPVFIVQRRIGLADRDFSFYKFRTMIAEKEKNGRKLTDVERIFYIGRLLRKSSIDELPQLFNVIKGDMSFIGPRPLPVHYLPHYTEQERHRHDVRPGLSGWAQVNGRNYLSWEKKFEYDIFYVTNFGPLLDLKIFLLTIKKVFLSADVGVGGKDKIETSLHEVRGKK